MRHLMTPLHTYREMVEDFRGYDHNLRIEDGSFWDMKNLTSDYWPALSPRKPRGIYAKPHDPQGMISKDSLCYVDGSAIYINQYRLELGLSVRPEDCPKDLISMGAYIIIMPDKKYVNTADLTDYGNIDAKFKTSQPVQFTLCREDGSVYGPEYVQPNEPKDVPNMTLWVDTSGEKHILKQYSESTGLWASLETVYVKISSAGIGKAFELYDGITIEGLKGEVITDQSGELVADTHDLVALEGGNVIWGREDDWILVVGMLDKSVTIQNHITIARKMPEVDFITESGNRLWGCRYGTDSSGQVVNQIYSSVLGDFKNWNRYMGSSDDSYFVNVGSDGQFTGAVSFLGRPCFFKEKMLHMVYGTEPRNFGVQSTALRGVQKGCHKSLAIVGETLYYKSRNAVCAYNGSMPVEVSRELGDIRYHGAVAAAHGNKYYVSMADDAEQYHVFVLDTQKHLWHKEDDLHALDLCSSRNELYAIDSDTKEIITMLGSGDEYETLVKWEAETGDLGLHSPGAKYISRLNIRMMLECMGVVQFFVQYDNGPEWEPIHTERGHDLQTFTLPVMVRRCDHLRLKLVGMGDCKVYSITKTIMEGSDIFDG